MRRDEQVGVRSRWFLSDPGSSPARARIQQLRHLSLIQRARARSLYIYRLSRWFISRVGQTSRLGAIIAHHSSIVLFPGVARRVFHPPGDASGVPPNPYAVRLHLSGAVAAWRQCICKERKCRLSRFPRPVNRRRSVRSKSLDFFLVHHQLVRSKS